MFNIGDRVIYSTHGICKIDDICEKTILGKTSLYYVLHPMENLHHLTISAPVDNDKVVMLELLHKDEATEIIDSFISPGVNWNDKANVRYHLYSQMVHSGDRKKIAQVVNTLLRNKLDLEHQNKKQYEQDRKLLESAQNILFKELAITLKTTFEEINMRVNNLIAKNKIKKTPLA